MDTANERTDEIVIRSLYYDNNNSLQKVITVSQEVYEFAVDKQTVDIDADGSVAATVDVRCSGGDSAWGVSASETWVTVTKKNGGFTISASRNTDTQSRTANVSVTRQNSPVVLNVNVVQAGASEVE